MMPIFAETKLEEIDAFMKKNYMRRVPRKYNIPKPAEFTGVTSQEPKLVSYPQQTKPGPQASPNQSQQPKLAPVK
jgi:hypothetical protein